jgi:hypothetical protein
MNKVILLRFARALAAVVIGFAATWIVSEDALSVIPDSYEPIFLAVVVPLLIAAEKFFRDGGDASA